MVKSSAKKDVKKDVKNDIKKDVKTDIKTDVKSTKTSKDMKAKVESKLNKPKPTKVEHGHLVSVDYVGKLSTGEEFDNSKNHGPIQFIVGNGQVIPGFDKAVVGMKVNDTKKFTIPKHEAYGDTNPALVQIVPLSKIPEHVRSQLKAGGFLVMQSPTGQQIPVKIIKMDKENVHLDMNHPLAGKDLTFDIKLVDVNHAPENSECGCGDDCSDGSCDSCGPSCDCGHDHK